VSTLAALLIGTYFAGILGILDIISRAQDEPEIREILDQPPAVRYGFLGAFLALWPLVALVVAGAFACVVVSNRRAGVGR
jgi:Na+/proline symporter